MALKVAIVGAGLAGLAAAVAASAAGAEVDVFESADRLAAPPVHLDVVPGLLRDLVSLGVGERCVRLGFPYRGVAVVDATGRPGFEIATPPLAGERWPAALGIGYAVLLQVLHDAALAQGARLHWSAPVTQVHAGPAGGCVLAGGRPAWHGDLVLLAGARDLAGIALPLAAPSHRLPQRWDHVLLPRPRGLDRSTWVVGPGRHKALLVPIDAGRAGLAVLRDAHEAGSAAALRVHLAAAGPLLAGLGARVAADTPVVARPVASGLLHGPWHDGALLRIGSSAHLLPPHFGQAAAQSVEDATVLRELLAAGLHGAVLMQHFMQRRAERAARVHAVATQAAQWDLQPEPATDLPALARQLAPIVAQAA